MDSPQLIDYLFRAKADINRCLTAIKGISSETSDTMNAVCETEKWLQSVRENVLTALTIATEDEKPDMLDDIAIMFNDADDTDSKEAYGVNSPEMWLQFSKACEIALHLGKISTAILVNRLDIAPSQADYLISKLVEEEIIPDLQNEAGEYIIF